MLELLMTMVIMIVRDEGTAAATPTRAANHKEAVAAAGAACRRRKSVVGTLAHGRAGQGRAGAAGIAVSSKR
jgi:hypothetical protein